jgi:ferric-dicitrate binding protein FerR (iron transport regulator)
MKEDVRKDRTMNRERFDHLLAAYGGDFSRWPAEERAAAAIFVAQDAEAAAALREAQALDRALGRNETSDTSALAARILAQAPRARPWLDRRAALALAACAVFGIVLGYGGGMLAPAPDVDDAYFAAAFEAPLLIGEEG